ncbi:hypothetical protein EDB85DRAFT_1921193, partial [Lactarius pseudohatsudake]
SFTGSASPVLPEVPQSEADFSEICEHTLVKTTFGKCPSTVTYAWSRLRRGAVLCSHCSIIAYSKCAGCAALTYDLVRT